MTNAKEFATMKHDGQMYGDKPYTYHLQKVVDAVEGWFPFLRIDNVYYTPVLLDLCWLHDTVEDTDTSFDEIFGLFSYTHGQCMRLLTDPEGNTRRKRKQALYRAYASHPDDLVKLFAAIVKCGDRFANHAECIKTNNREKMDMYVEEFPEFATYIVPSVLKLDISTMIPTALFAQYRIMLLK